MNILCFDLETTGVNANDCQVVELACVLCDGQMSPITSLASLVYTDMPWEMWKEASEAAHGLKPEDIEHAPDWDEVSPIVQAMFDVADVLAGHNIEAYDMRILSRLGIEFPERFKVIDTMKQLTRGGRWQKLEALMSEFGVEREGQAHSALSDVRGVIGIIQAARLNEKLSL